jgi:hypothetical protein
MRLFRDEYGGLVSHLGGEDSAYATEPRLGLARRAAALSCELIHLEDQIGGCRAAGREPDLLWLDMYCRMTGVYRRVLVELGLGRQAKPIESLSSYLEAKRVTDGRVADAEDAEVDPPC